MGLENSLTDPCIFHQWDSEYELKATVVCYCDDFIIMGSKESVSSIKDQLRTHYMITDLGPLSKHLGVSYEWKTDKLGPYIAITMGEFTNGLIVDFKEEFGRLPKEYATPAFPGSSLVKRKPEEDIVRHEAYRTMVGKLLWLVKKHAVDCCNITRELSSHMQAPTQAHWKAGECVLGFLIRTWTENSSFEDQWKCGLRHLWTVIFQQTGTIGRAPVGTW
jgi:hypothetical protein